MVLDIFVHYLFIAIYLFQFAVWILVYVRCVISGASASALL